MIHITTGSRLHFGLFHLPGEALEFWPDRTGTAVFLARPFGGVGLMIEEPGIELTLTPAGEWSAEGPLGQRALDFARRYIESTPAATRPCHLAVHRCAPEHVGLGTGTQLGMAVSRALAEISGLGDVESTELAQRVGRGLRSALGVHGFAQGGFLVEGGQREEGIISPLISRVEFPDEWRIVLVLPREAVGLHGRAENDVFTGLRTPSVPWTESLCRLVLLGMLPALVERDIQAFGEAVYDFNARVGEAFSPVQGGIYADSRSAALVRFAREQGILGVGQSSWGPSVFAMVSDEERAKAFAHRLRREFCLSEHDVVLTRARNRGAAISRR
jgi:beta-RFAP synthase